MKVASFIALPDRTSLPIIGASLMGGPPAKREGVAKETGMPEFCERPLFQQN